LFVTAPQTRVLQSQTSFIAKIGQHMNNVVKWYYNHKSIFVAKIGQYMNNVVKLFIFFSSLA
jgi:hypothetical protein